MITPQVFQDRLFQGHSIDQQAKGLKGNLVHGNYFETGQAKSTNIDIRTMVRILRAFPGMR